VVDFVCLCHPSLDLLNPGTLSHHLRPILHLESKMMLTTWNHMAGLVLTREMLVCYFRWVLYPAWDCGEAVVLRISSSPPQPVHEQLIHSAHHVYSTHNPAVTPSDLPKTKSTTTMLPYTTPLRPRNLVTTPPSLSCRRPSRRPRRIA
jgi:hypothetical protein